MTVTAAIASGTLVNQRYRIVAAIASGGFGRTYLAWDEVQNQHRLLKEFSCNPHNQGLSQQSQMLFEREAAILQRLSHPQIPRFFGTFESEGRLFLVQEYIEGQTYRAILQNRSARRQTLSQGEIIRWLRSLLPVLDYLHGCGIIHRDISPDNIMQPRDGSPLMLIDFGAAIALDSTTTPETVGKFGYAPPEQLEPGQCYPNSDLYALGATALVLLTGKLPSQLYNTQQQRWQWRRWRKMSPDLARVLEKMVAAKPAQRWQSAAAVLQALPPAPSFDLPSEWLEPLPPPRYDYRRIAIAIILLCLGITFLFTLPAICQPLGWCDRELPSPPFEPYPALHQQAYQAAQWGDRATTIAQLSQASQQLQRAIAQLQKIPPDTASYFLAQQTAIAYQLHANRITAQLTQAQIADQKLQKLERLAQELLSREQQITTPASLSKLLAEWQQLWDNLNRLPKTPFIADRRQQLRKEYQNARDRLQAEITRLSESSS